jgi:tRNA U54 and U55 pseudouridine synthase Pus10
MEHVLLKVAEGPRVDYGEKWVEKGRCIKQQKAVRLQRKFQAEKEEPCYFCISVVTHWEMRG